MELRTAPAAARRNLYGRGRRRRLRPGRRAALERLLPQLTLRGVSPYENPDRRALPAGRLLRDARDIWIEIGFGAGEHLLATAREHEDIEFLGAEPYLAGVSALLAAMADAPPANLRIHPGDGRDLLDVIPDGLVGRAFLLYPDPWPKRRHARRRFVNPRNLDALARIMRPRAEFRVATDMPFYARHALAAASTHPGFHWTAERPEDWRGPWPGWPGTRYERKALAAGRRPIYLTFRRRRGERP